MTSPDEVLVFLQPRVTSATAPADVAALMAPLAADSAWVHLGGSGARQQIFRLPGDVRAVFQFDPNDRLVAYGAYRTREPWGNDQGGARVAPVSVPDVPLILLLPDK